MILFYPGRWSSKNTGFFIYDRLYYKNKASRLVRVKLRYLKTLKEWADYRQEFYNSKADAAPAENLPTIGCPFRQTRCTTREHTDERRAGLRSHVFIANQHSKDMADKGYLPTPPIPNKPSDHE
jgi:hypothetical protein